ncbi:SDR family oxidoreductase [Ralstonia solanacearum]|uniref:SDR family oxidoreductase n=1 Tax=Ralstonia solanacearum TaxID=305 RepID=UPI000E66C59F|nr:SDR family oxidoreductase [Ralstonia solanacearum]QOK80739.1 SDR family oxidoreductase [Ralstonia solanacearum]RIJ86903.1 NAD-dependent dehydratase [Ralstonia solanacearum]
MKVLVCGASGFIGQSISRYLASVGHEVVRGVRKPVLPGDIPIDFSTDTDVPTWLGRLAGIDVVVNAVGILTEHPTARFETIHHRAPAALFAACAEAGVTRVIQISALGAEHGDTPYFKSKHAADQALMRLPIAWQILRPALVYGRDGASASLFRILASLPVIPVPEVGQAAFQPIHIDDLVRGIGRAIDPAVPAGQQIDMVGGERVTYRAMLETYRRAMGFEHPLYVTIPAALMGAAARLSAWMPGAPLTPDTWRMLQGGSAADAAATTRLLGYPPKRVAQFIAPDCAELLRLRALAAWRTGLLRYVLAMLWMATACVSAFVYPMADSLALLKQVGLAGWPAIAVLYGASILDLMMGVACIRYPCRALWGMQAALVVGYTVVVCVALPQFLAHPFGPVIKNAPILAILAVLFAESKSWTT